MRETLCLLAVAGIFLVQPVCGKAFGITDDDVVQAVAKGQKFIQSQQVPDGTWSEGGKIHGLAGPFGHSELAFFTLVYTHAYKGDNPLKDEGIQRGLEAILAHPLEHTYPICMRAMALAHLQMRLHDSKERDRMREALRRDVVWLVRAQGGHGGWSYKSLGGAGTYEHLDDPNARFDLSNTQMAILALREAALAGIEIPDKVWERTQALYFKLQQADGSWNYGDPHYAAAGGTSPGYGSMTAAGLASIYITQDFLQPGAGCPCRGDRSSHVRGEAERRIEAALRWLEQNFKSDANPRFTAPGGGMPSYWLYCVERVGLAAGYKYFGSHNWFKETAERLVKGQQPNGSWGGLADTCFLTLFLYKGRAPILYNKLEFVGEWNNHRRDIANLTAYIEKAKEQFFRWQIVNLRAPVEELHDAPILFITLEGIPTFTDEEKQKLRQFTDTGGTILLEASCGNRVARKWIENFVKATWPEWGLKPLGPDHPSFLDPYPLNRRPEVLGVNDGLRTSVFYAMDDISCPWNTKAYTGREYLFTWGINLFTYATDGSPLRANLENATPEPTERYTAAVKGGPRSTLQLARVKYGKGTAWLTNYNYKPFDRLVAALKAKASVTLTVEKGGVAPADLGDHEIAYLVGTAEEFKLSDAEKEGLKAYVARGGFLWVEAAAGAPAFATNFAKVAQEMGWELKLLDPKAPMMSGRFDHASGHDLTQGVQFRRTLRILRTGPGAHADLLGIYAGDTLVGVFSPLDAVFCMTDYESGGCQGYRPPDALAVAMNIVLSVTDRPAGEPPAVAAPAEKPPATK